MKNFPLAMLMAITVLLAFPVRLAFPQGSSHERFTLPQVLSAPFPSELKAAPALYRVSWLSNRQGRRNLLVAEPGKDGYSVRQLTQFTEDDGVDLGDVAWAPDAQAIAYVRGGDFEEPSKAGANPALLPEGIEQNIWLVRLNAGPASKPFKVAAGRAPLFTKDGQAILYLSFGQIWTVQTSQIGALATPEGAKPEQILHTRGDIQTMRLSPDGKRLAFVSSRGDHAFIGVYDLIEKSLIYLDPSTDRDDAPTWSPDGKQLAFLRIASSGDAYEFAPHREAELPWSIRVADAQTGHSREIWKASSGPGSVFHAISTDDQLSWTAANQIVFPWELDGWLHLYAVPQSGGTAKLLTPGGFEVEHASLSQDRRLLVYSSNQDDIDRRHLWKLDVSTATIPPPVALTSGDGIEVYPAIASDNRTVLTLRSDARLPLRPACLAKSGKLEDLAAGAAPGSIPADYPSTKLVIPQQVIFPAADGMQIHGQLFQPPAGTGPARHPALVFFHGGSRRQMLLGWHYMDYYSNAYAMNQYLASLGYVVLSVNYRSGIGYGLNFREALQYGAAGASEFNDVQGAGIYLRNRPDVDPARIGSWGGSYGGYLTALALARASDLFAAGVDFHGVHDWNIELGNWNTDYDPKADTNRSRVAFESSPIASISTWRSPVLLIHGDDDRNVQFTQTPKLAGMLRRQKVEVEELIFPDEIHGFLLYRDWLAAYTAETDFFGRRLKP